MGPTAKVAPLEQHMHATPCIGCSLGSTVPRGRPLSRATMCLVHFLGACISYSFSGRAPRPREQLMHARSETPGARELQGGPLEIADPREGPVHGVACISYSQGATYAWGRMHKLLYSKGDPLVPSIRESNLCTGLHAYVAQRGRPLRWAPCVCGYSTAGVIYKIKKKKSWNPSSWDPCFRFRPCSMFNDICIASATHV